MNLSIFFASTLTNSLLTAGILIGLILIFVIENKLIKNHEDTISKTTLVLVYLVTFLIALAGILGIFAIWNFDFVTYVNEVWSGFLLTLEDSIGRIISSLIIIFVAMMILKISKVTLKKIGQKDGPNKRRKRTVARVTRSITKYVVGIIAILSVLSIWGVNVGPALAGLGILGLVVGLGAQRFINDLIAGFFIIFEHHFDVGDKIEVQGFKGEVIDIGLKTTKVKNWKGEIRIMNNGDVTNLIQFSKDLSVAVIDFGIAYHEDVQKTTEVLTLELPKIRNEFPEIVEDPKVLGVINLNNSSVDMRVICKTLNEQHYGVERAIRQRIKLILDEHGIEIPFPQVVVHQPKKS